MIIFGIAAALLLSGLILGAWFMKHQNDQADMRDRQTDIDSALEKIYELRAKQQANLLALAATVQRYADDEVGMLANLTTCANNLGTAVSPEDLKAAAKTASQALQALYTVARYYPPLVNERGYLAEEEAANNCEQELQKALEHYTVLHNQQAGLTANRTRWESAAKTSPNPERGSLRTQ